MAEIIANTKAEVQQEPPTPKPDGKEYTAEEIEEYHKRAPRSKLNEKLKELIPEVAAGCKDKTYKVKRVKVPPSEAPSSKPLSSLEKVEATVSDVRQQQSDQFSSN